MGGWSAILASRMRGEREVADQRILANGDFVKQVISDLDDLGKENLRLSGQRIDIKALAEKVSERYNVSVGELRSGGRRRTAVKARRAMSWIGVLELGYSGADVARYLGVTSSCVTRMISATLGEKQIQAVWHDFLIGGTLCKDRNLSVRSR